MFGGFNRSSHHPQVNPQEMDYRLGTGASDLANQYWPPLGGLGHYSWQQTDNSHLPPYFFANQSGHYLSSVRPVIPVFSSLGVPLNHGSFENPIAHFNTTNLVAGAGRVGQQGEEDRLYGPPPNGAENSLSVSLNALGYFNPILGVTPRQNSLDTASSVVAQNEVSAFSNYVTIQPNSAIPMTSENDNRPFLETVAYISTNYGLAGKKNEFYFDRSSIEQYEELVVGDQVYGVAHTVPNYPTYWYCQIVHKYNPRPRELMGNHSKTTTTNVVRVLLQDQCGSNSEEPRLTRHQSGPTTLDHCGVSSATNKRSRSKSSKESEAKKRKITRNRKEKFSSVPHIPEVSTTEAHTSSNAVNVEPVTPISPVYCHSN